MLEVLKIHHVSLPCTNLERSKRFYRDVIGLTEIERPPFDFPGAWFSVSGGQQLHLIVWKDTTLREGKGISGRDIHFAIRVSSFKGALAHLEQCGYSAEASDEMHRMRVDEKATAGFPQIYILDPDRNVIEINSEALG